MRHLLVSVAAATLALTSFASSPVAAAGGGGQSKFAVCHFAGNMRQAEGTRTGRILLLPFRAAVSHLRHGDAPAGVAPVMRNDLRNGQECMVDEDGVVTVDDEVVFDPALARAALEQLVRESDLSDAEKELLLRLIAEFFDD